MDLKSILNLSDSKQNMRTAPAHQTINEEAGLGPEWQPVDRPPIVPASAPQAGDEGSSRYLQGSLPPGYQHDTSFVGTSYRASNTPLLSLMPLGIQGNPSTNAAIMSTAKLTAAPSSVAPAAATLGDGLTHGRLPWSGDAGVSQVSDDFYGAVGGTYNGGLPLAGIGQLGWNLIGTPGPTGGGVGGVPPYLGQFTWTNNNVSDIAAWLVLNSAGTYNSLFEEAYALADNPGWIMTFVFKLDSNLTTIGFSMLQKAMYVGLVGAGDGTAVANITARPNVFIGIRYDTSTGIGDSFLTLEVVANQTLNVAARNNTQGTTLVTDVTPEAGVWHRLDIFCSTAGSITLTLDGSGTNTLTTAIPTSTVTTTIGSNATGAGAAQLSWFGGDPVNPFSIGSTIAATGFTGTSDFLNGTLPAPFYVEQNLIYINAPGTFSNSDTVTLTGYPALQPAAIFGNDNQATPSASGANFSIDFWSFVWNPNLGPNKPGTPDPTLPRYF